ncbi:dehydrogenase [Lachnospiraceae bacterium]|uniref:pyruvate formate lyase family protein n=1 Tax=Extibacter sp. GGCC_0201 TaxID=2731209 RepID=UPI001AA16130|nr:pyruvate formate lyase family protein [Extibacter sp. GGCC_0201]MBO1721876.1 hypothetical protein [Extibacter sp. GGCC_0201]BDF35067.1 dehydrogenase [Lachnospiraceae bacterium]BDF39068.1 dehydrogenase [Lachnospiraceae bacterium]
MTRSDRIKVRLFDEDFMKKKEWWGEGETILTEEEIKKKPLIIRKALAIEHVAKYMPVSVRPDELIVGVPTMASVGFGRCFPVYALPEEEERAARCGYTVKSVAGHHPADYEKLLRIGLKGVREEIEESRREKERSGELDEETDHLYASMLISLNAVGILAGRYVELLRQEAKQEREEARKKELLQMMEVCSRVPENPSETFQEALQSVWLLFAFFHSTMEFLPIGRSDQYLYPYYKADIAAGRITEEQAEELIISWLAKFSERVQLKPEQWEMHLGDMDSQFNGRDMEQEDAATYDNDESYNYGTSANHWLINMILGGMDGEGVDATNDLTYLILEGWKFLEAVTPTMSVRFHKNTPQKLYELCASILRKGAGEPVLYNDEPIIEGLVRMGIPLREARNYSNDGCWETLIPGKTSFSFCMNQVLQMLEYQLQQGRSLVRGRVEKEGLPPLSSYSGYESFYKVFLRILEDNARTEIRNKIRFSKARSDIAPSPLLSAFMDDCIKRGREYSDGGAVYDIFTLMLCGFSGCVDSLTVIKKLVFEEQRITLTELAEATRANFKGYEALHQYICNHVPKFGNDEPYCDEIARGLVEDFKVIADRLRAEGTGKYMIGLGIATFEFYAKWGHDIGASADGRLSQEPIGSNVSPVIGMDKAGPTALIRSVTTLDWLPYAIGGPLDMQVNPNEVSGPQGISRMTGLIRSYFDLGGLMLTITGVNAQMLEDARKDPMRHKSLRVRLGGMSAYFISLSEEMQESIIRKTKHSF